MPNKVTLGRHVAAVLAAYIVGYAALQGVAIDAQQVNALMLLAYAIVEKALKPLARKLGEPIL